jgi:hypothetical protein
MTTERMCFFGKARSRESGSAAVKVIMREAKDEMEKAGLSSRSKRILIGLAAAGILAGIAAGTGQFEKIDLKRMHDGWVKFMINVDNGFRESVNRPDSVKK